MCSKWSIEFQSVGVAVYFSIFPSTQLTVSNCTSEPNVLLPVANQDLPCVLVVFFLAVVMCIGDLCPQGAV